MEHLLLLLHTEPDGSIDRGGLEVLDAARALGATLGPNEWSMGLVGGEVSAAANQLATSGAARFLGIDGPEFALPRYGTDAAAAEAICRAAESTIILAPATSRWNRVLPGVAQRLGGRVDTHVTGLASDGGKLTVQRWFYRQRMEAAIQRAARPWIILVEPGTHQAWQGSPGTAALEKISLALPDTAKRTTVLGTREPATNAQTIRPDANLLFVAGAGWTKKQADGEAHVADAEQLIRRFLEITRASLGSSKSLVDISGEGQAVLSFLTHMNQIGQTGSTPRHPKGLATCCHGEEPHTVGWRFITERRAISLDPNCGWARGKADVLYIADAFAVIRKLNETLAG
ncbi:MAG: electron transfer flavoprotein subunit alpha/FixB family protein [Verrucomicrobiia bacterium]